MVARELLLLPTWSYAGLYLTDPYVDSPIGKGFAPKLTPNGG